MADQTSMYLTFSFENLNREPESLSVNSKTIGKDIYDKFLDIGLDVDKIKIYNSYKLDFIYEDDNMVEMVRNFEDSKTSTAQREIPLLTVIMKSEPSEHSKKPRLNRTTSIAREKQCIVFDFDCTLTKRHWYHFNNDLTYFIKIYSMKGPASLPPSLKKLNLYELRDKYYEGDEAATKKVTELIWGDYKRIDMIKEFLITAKDKYGYDLFISSRGLVEDIEKGLDLIDSRNLFKNYQGTASPQRLGLKVRDQPESCSNPKTKADFILKCLYDSNYFDVIYIDDDPSEHNTINRLLPDTKWAEEDRRYYFIPGPKKDTGGGIEKREIDELYDTIENVVTSV